MNTSFKLGDRVELIEDYHAAHELKGAQGILTKDIYTNRFGGDVLTEIQFDGGQLIPIRADRLKLVETPVKLGDIVRITNFASNPSSDHIGKIVTINRLSKAEGTNYQYYGTEEGSPENLERGEFVVLPEVVVKAHEYKIGDTVQVTIPAGDTESFGGAYFQTGTGTVEMAIHNNRLMVRGSASKDGGRWWVDKKYVTPLVEELPFEVGSRVRTKAGYLDGGSEGIVTRLYGGFGGDIEVAWETGYAVTGLPLGASRSGLEVIASPVVERPKATPVTEAKPQIGDTIVAFWGDFSKGEVETRKKGVVAHFDRDGTAVSVDGEYITYDPDGGEAAEDSVFIVERAPKPEPVKELPEQFLLDAPVGSKAVNAEQNLQYIKTGKDEWSLVFDTKLGVPRSSERLAVSDEGVKRLTLHVL